MSQNQWYEDVCLFFSVPQFSTLPPACIRLGTGINVLWADSGSLLVIFHNLFTKHSLQPSLRCLVDKDQLSYKLLTILSIFPWIRLMLSLVPVNIRVLVFSPFSNCALKLWDRSIKCKVIWARLLQFSMLSVQTNLYAAVDLFLHKLKSIDTSILTTNFGGT